VVISTGFDDVRPFRRGVAPVRRGRWGAVDNTGRVLLPFQYLSYSTALTDGRYIDGFTDEGLAIVDTPQGKGVVDRNGRVIVPPGHPNLVIHPVAFLISGPNGWGALDRRGRPLIDPELRSRLAGIEQIDRTLADTNPVLCPRCSVGGAGPPRRRIGLRPPRTRLVRVRCMKYRYLGRSGMQITEISYGN